MSSEGAYARYSAPGSKNPYGQSYSTAGGNMGYGGGSSAYGSGYGAGPAPTYGGGSYSTPSYAPAAPASAAYGQVRLLFVLKMVAFTTFQGGRHFSNCFCRIPSDSFLST